jgi:hypothetical protein
MKNIDWIEYYKQQVGGQYSYFKGSQFQEGYGFIEFQSGDGFGDIFRRFASWVVPIIKKHAIPTLESGVKAIGREALDSAADVAKDILSGRDFKTSASSRYKSAIDTLKEKAEKTIDGRGLKRKNTSINSKKSNKNKIILKKIKTNRNSYIFD